MRQWRAVRDALVTRGMTRQAFKARDRANTRTQTRRLTRHVPYHPFLLPSSSPLLSNGVCRPPCFLPPRRRTRSPSSLGARASLHPTSSPTSTTSAARVRPRQHAPRRVYTPTPIAHPLPIHPRHHIRPQRTVHLLRLLLLHPARPLNRALLTSDISPVPFTHMSNAMATRSAHTTCARKKQCTHIHT